MHWFLLLDADEQCGRGLGGWGLGGGLGEWGGGGEGSRGRGDGGQIRRLGTLTLAPTDVSSSFLYPGWMRFMFTCVLWH